MHINRYQQPPWCQNRQNILTYSFDLYWGCWEFSNKTEKNRSYWSSPKLIPAIDDLLFHAEDNWAQILVVGEVIPVLRPVEIALISFLFYGRELEGSGPIELLLNGRLSAGHLVFVYLRHARRTHLINRFPYSLPAHNEFKWDILPGCADGRAELDGRSLLRFDPCP